MATFQDRLLRAFARENERRLAAGEPRLTKTDIWRAAGASSGAATHWFDGSNGMDLDTCVKAAPVLRVNPFWLYDESKPIDADFSSQQKQKSPLDLYVLSERGSTVVVDTKTSGEAPSEETQLSPIALAIAEYVMRLPAEKQVEIKHWASVEAALEEQRRRFSQETSEPVQKSS